MRTARAKLLLAAAGLSALLVIAGWAAFWRGGGPEYRTAPVERGAVVATIAATGAPNAVVTVQVGSQVSGNVMALYADFNTKVKKGQLVARIDPQMFQAKVDQNQAALDAAKAAVVNAQAGVEKANADVASASANLANMQANLRKAHVAAQDAKAKLDRRVELANEGVISREDLDTAQAAYDSAVADEQAAQAQAQAAQDTLNAAKAELNVAYTQLASAQAQVKQAQAALAQAQVDLDHTYIRAPVDGVVVARNVDVGQTVAASLQAPTLFQIAQDLTKMQVDTNVSEADVGRVKLGQTATFTVDAYPGRVFTGQVSQIRQAPINVQNVITYDVVIAVPNPDLKLFPGMTANVKILVDRRQNVLKIPNSALRFRPAGADSGAVRVAYAGDKKTSTDPIVYVLGEGGKPKPVPVKLGLTDGTYTEVTAGDLKEGDLVITASLAGKTPTAKTAPVGRGPRF
jgi:HlyD family secretion protein